MREFMYGFGIVSAVFIIYSLYCLALGRSIFKERLREGSFRKMITTSRLIVASCDAKPEDIEILKQAIDEFDRSQN